MADLTIQKLDEVRVRVMSTSGTIRHELKEAFSYFVPNFRHMPKYKMGIWDGRISLYDLRSSSTYVGLLTKVLQFADNRGLSVEIDQSEFSPHESIELDSFLASFKVKHELREYQKEVLRIASTDSKGLFLSATGCHPLGTKVVTISGEVKNVEDVKPGDELIGPDGKSRTVLSLIRGRGRIYKISSTTKYAPKFKDWFVNDQHVLSLMCNNKKKPDYGKIVNITVEEYLKKDKYFKHTHKLFFLETPAEFTQKQAPNRIEPWFLGYYLGNGSCHSLGVTCLPEEPVIESIRKEASRFDISPRIAPHKGSKAVLISITDSRFTKRNPNPLTMEFRSLGLNIGTTDETRLTCQTKFIPEVYKRGSIETRLAVLAGIIDSDGWLAKRPGQNGCGFGFVSKSKRLFDDVAFIARSLGFFVTEKEIFNKRYQRTYYRMSITGDVHKIPVKLERKRAVDNSSTRNKSYHRYGFTVEEVGTDDFYGFNLDQDRLYCLDNFLVTHNSGKSLSIYALIRLINKPTLLIVPSIQLVGQMYGDFKDYSSVDPDFDVDEMVQQIHGGQTKEVSKQIVISTWQSIYKLPPEYFQRFELVIADEAHEDKSDKLRQLIEKCKNSKYRYGFTGTLDGTLTNEMILRGLFGDVHQVSRTSELIDKGVLADMKLKQVILQYPPEARKENARKVYQEEVGFLLSCEARMNFLTKLTLKCPGNTLVLFQRVEEHGEKIFEQLKHENERLGLGRKIFLVHGGISKDKRLEIVNVAEQGDGVIIVASLGTFSRGINIRNLENLIFAFGLKAKITTLQGIGRGLRIGRSNKVTVFDICDDLSWKSWNNYSLRHAMERMKIYQEERFNYSVVKVRL